MQLTINPTQEIVDQAKAGIERFSARVLHLLSFVPDDKLDWKPSPTAKSFLLIVGHCAATNKFFAKVIEDQLCDPLPTPEEFFKNLDAMGSQYTTRETAIAAMRESTLELKRAVESVNAENIDATRTTPFGEFPVRFWLAQGTEHLADHCGQLEYLQTIWGDMDNHFN